MFRRVDLPARIPGKLLLHSMPGRFEAIERVWHQLRRDAVGAIVCLNEKHELNMKSSKYAEALESGTVPCSVLPFEIREGGVPEDRDAFWALANDVAKRLRSGEGVLVHCAGGIGRTAMLAVTVLLVLGESLNEAENLVSRAGSMVETMPQIEMLSWCVSRREELKDSSSTGSSNT
jgi:protein-tyrosine phosphatase